MPANRIVTLLTPLLFAPLAGLITGALAKYGLGLDSGEVEDVIVEGILFLGGVLVAWLKSRQWLKGWQAWEKRLDDSTNGALNDEMQKFLEAIAEKTGVAVPGVEQVQDFIGGQGADPPPAARSDAWEGTEAGL